MIGHRVGHYEIGALIGAGGMGEVYRARDTRVQRDVAIKVLPQGSVHTHDQIARFEREAQTLATLNHPNIAHLYGVEEFPSADAMTRALVMELIEGDDLAARLRRGPIQMEEALSIALQVAQGLAAAHDHGVIHRDLKPANIKLTSDGTVKLLDFGLAKFLKTPSASADESLTITSAAEVTRDGVVLGTAAYMSPEHARGLPLDERADIWALGAVLFEMLTGKRAFPGDAVSDSIAAVLKSDPDWDALPAHTPFLIRRLLRNALNKDARKRVSHVRDAALDIQDAIDRVDEPQGVGSGRKLSSSWQLMIPVLLTLGALVIGLSISRSFFNDPFPTTTTTIRSSLLLPEGADLNGSAEISPDGKLVIVPTSEPRAGLWLRRLADGDIRFLAGTEEGQRPFWAPDSRRIGFFANTKLKTIDVSSGTVAVIADAPGAFGGAWNSSDLIIYSPHPAAGLQQVHSSGGPSSPITELDPASETGHRWPFFLHDGTRFGYVVQAPTGRRLAFASASKRLALIDVSGLRGRAVFSPPDTLLIVREGTALALRFDVTRLALTGDGLPIATNVGSNAAGATYLSVSSAGALIHSPPTPQQPVRLAWVDRRGRITYVDVPPADYADPSLSPDGSRIAVSRLDNVGALVWTYDISSHVFEKRTFADFSFFPVWTPDGDHLTFTRGQGATGPLMQIAADGSGTANVLVSDAEHPGMKIATSWSADGKVLVFQSNENIVERGADGSIRPVLNEPVFEREARFSPDGRWLAYRSNETGADNIFVQSYPLGRGKWQISTSGGTQPMWAQKGHELYFKRGNQMMVVPVTLQPSFKPGLERVLFETPLPTSPGGDPSRYGVSQDGQRFLIMTAEPALPRQLPRIELITNWRALVDTEPR